MVACGSMGETKVEWVDDGGGMVEEVLRDDEVDTRGWTLTCGLGDGGTELRSGGIVLVWVVGGLWSWSRQQGRDSAGRVRLGEKDG